MDDKTLSVFALPNARSGEAYLCELVSADPVAARNVVNQVVADEDMYREALVRRLNGRMIVQSTAEGTIVTLLFPLAPATLRSET